MPKREREVALFDRRTRRHSASSRLASAVHVGACRKVAGFFAGHFLITIALTFNDDGTCVAASRRPASNSAGLRSIKISPSFPDQGARRVCDVSMVSLYSLDASKRALEDDAERFKPSGIRRGWCIYFRDTHRRRY